MNTFNTPIKAVEHGRSALRQTLARPVLFSALALSLPAVADSPSINFHFEAGGEYDSNVSLVELDKVTHQSDWATTLSAGVKAHWGASDRLNLRAGLQQDHKHYLTYDEFDLDVTRGFLEASYDFSALTLGVSQHQALARLDQQDFLALSQTHVFASKLINSQLYLRGQLSDQSKTFSTQPARNAHNQGWGGDVYWFTQQGQSYLSLGIAREQESAQLANYSYEGTTLRARWSHNFSLASLPSQWQLGWRYVEKDFIGPATEAAPSSLASTSTQPNRADQQFHWDTKWAVELNQAVSLATKVTYSDYRSNFDSADYRETLAAIQLTARF